MKFINLQTFDEETKSPGEDIAINADYIVCIESFTYGDNEGDWGSLISLSNGRQLKVCENPIDLEYGYRDTKEFPIKVWWFR